MADLSDFGKPLWAKGVADHRSTFIACEIYFLNDMLYKYNGFYVTLHVSIN